MYKKCILNNCDLEALEIDHHCILHYGGKNPSHVEEFSTVIEKLIDGGYNHFHQIQFPSGYNSFPEKIEFNKATFIDCQFDSGFDFLNTKFVGITVFERNRFKSDIRFLTCEIQDDFYMRGNSYREQLFFSNLKTITQRNKIVIQDLSGFSPTNVPNNLLFDSCNLIDTRLILKSMILKSATWRFVDNNFTSSKLNMVKLNLTGQIEFRGNMTSGNTFMSSEINIGNTKFSGHEVFIGRGNTFDKKSKIVFYNVKFFSNKTPFRKFNFSAPTEFVRCEFNENVDFTNTKNISHCLFKQSNIDVINFDGADWSKPYKVRDETILEHDYTPGKVGKERKSIIRNEYVSASQTYRKLKINYENQREHSLSSKFYIRERECSRKSLPWQNQFFPWIFHFTCDYGESPFKIIYSIALTIIIFGILYLFNGFKYMNEIIDYDFTLTYINFDFFDLFLALWLSVKSMLVAFGRPGEFSEMSTLVSFLLGIESIIGVLLIGLFVIIFPRQFRK